MFERIVEHWLTSVGERGFETPFAQLLSIDGHRVIQAPVHHGSEHGKDILSFDARGQLCAYQLKGDVNKLADLEGLQQQLFALSAAAVQHPAVQPPRRADVVYLVTNSTPSPNARNRLLAISQGNTAAGLPPFEWIELTELSGMFARAHDRFLPSEPEDLRRFLTLYLDDGTGLFPVRELDDFLEELTAGERGVALERAVASAVLFTAYTSGAWERHENHFAVAQAWLTMSLVILRRIAIVGESRALIESMSLSREAAGRALSALLQEAAEKEDLAIPSPVEGQVYGVRALLVCGAIAARFLELSTGFGAVTADERERTKRVLLRERPYLRLAGEASVPYLYNIACALSALGETDNAGLTLAVAMTGLVHANQRGSKNPIADPYHSIEEEMLSLAGVDQEYDDEEMDGHAYTLQVMIDWLARRGARDFLGVAWKEITRIDLCEFRFSAPEAMLSQDDEAGDLQMTQPGQPESWSRLLSAARHLERKAIPEALWDHLDFAPYVPLLIPHHFGPPLAKLIDLLATANVIVDGEPPDASASD